jgi:hypothetical protein
MTKTPDHKRKAAERARMRTRGFVLRQLWVHPDDWESVREYVERKRKKRSALLNGVDDGR